jgi:hypothetical protein
MSKRRNILLGLLAGLILIPVLLLVVFHHATDESAVAREKLDQVLGQGQPSLPHLEDSMPSPPPDATLPPPSTLPDNNGGTFFGLPLPLPQTGVKVEETPDSYVLRIPLADPKDASSVKLNVTPNRIEVSGQTGSKADGASITSSFMQSFTTSQEVLPGQVTRRTEQNGEDTEMVITIPKKQSGLGGADSNPPEMQPNQPSQPDNNIDVPQTGPNPLYGVENKVI